MTKKKELKESRINFFRELSLKESGYLVLIDDKIYHFNTKKEWESFEEESKKYTYQFFFDECSEDKLKI